MKKTIVLEISSWAGTSIGAEHYYGRLMGYADNKITYVELKKTLTQREADCLNKKDESYVKLKQGDESTRFNSKKEIREKAIEIWKQHFPYDEFLLEGRFAVCNPQKCLVAPDGLKDKINSLYEEQERIGGYERSPKRTEEIYREYTKLIAEYFAQ